MSAFEAKGLSWASARGRGVEWSWVQLSDFDYDLPPELIAQAPLEDRAGSRMLVLHREKQRWEDRMFRDLPAFLGPGDCLVLNDSKVFACRLFGRRAGVHALPVGRRNPKRQENLSGTVEVFLLRPVSADGKEWEALVRPGKKMRTGERVRFGDTLEAEITSRGEFGERTLRFLTGADVYAAVEQIGHVPLPPYIKRADAPADRERYQTVYARERGSVAAPTAGLHFTSEVLERCRAAGAEIAYVTLHVGLGTFQPIHAEQLDGARLHAERYSISAENAAKMKAARRLVAVGTTSVRSIESANRESSHRESEHGPGQVAGETNLFIYPGFQFARTGAMLTNFHLPRTSLLLLACAFGGADLVLGAYRHAIEKKYRFYSYGDCMLIL